MFQKKPQYVLVEAHTRLSAPAEGVELREGLRALRANPFFLYILDRLRTQRQLIEGRHKAANYQTLNAVSNAQQAIFWSGWLQSELDKLTEEPPAPALSPTGDEEEAFYEMDALLRRVGQ